MLTFITGLLSKFNWTSVVAVVSALIAILWGVFKGKSADTKVAKANQKVSDVKAEVAQANTAAVEKKAEAITNVAKAVKETAKIPDSDLDKEGESMGIVRD